jgi:NhaP-type Na+/H+ or K+/H+ antiporter
VIALIVGVALGPHGANFVRPLDYAGGDQEQLEAITLAFTRLVLGVQLVLAGVQLPKNYLMRQWRSLGMLLGPVMALKWLVSSVLVWWLVPEATFVGLLPYQAPWMAVEAVLRPSTLDPPADAAENAPQVFSLAAAACITPTDPILANSIVKGKFADAHIPPSLQKIITAESGANDGLGYPFLFAALYVLKYSIIGTPTYSGGASTVIKLWFGETIGYVVLLSVVYGAAVGWLAKDLLHWAEKRKLVDRESFLVFAIALALFIVGTCGMIGSDDVLACFIAGM